MKHDYIYLNVLRYILNFGISKTDRTNTGTLSATGINLRYNLRDDTVPILTSKKINLDALLNELLWFVRGSGSGRRLHEKKVKIWDEWMTPDEHLGYLYGYQWRFWPAAKLNKSMLVRDLSAFISPDVDIDFNDPSLTASTEYNGGYHSVNITDQNQWNEEYFCLWGQMLETAESDGYTIAPEWRIYENFAHDIKYVPGLHFYLDDIDEWCLTPVWSNSKVYHRDTVAFMHFTTEAHIKDSEHVWASHFGSEYLLDKFYVDEDDNEQLLPNVEGYVRRPRLHHDQLQNAIDLIKTDPYSRRIIVNCWNVDMLDEMQLAPCHFSYQFINNPVGGQIETSLRLDMRSNDYCLGNPFNIAQYSILLRMVCHVCGTVPGELLFNGGDVHIYSNHIEQAKLQLGRCNEITNSPTLSFARPIDNIDDFKFEDFIIEGYNPHPFIKFPVAV